MFSVSPILVSLLTLSASVLAAPLPRADKTISTLTPTPIVHYHRALIPRSPEKSHSKSKTTSTSDPSSTSSSNSQGGGSSNNSTSLANLFPVTVNKKWTTLPGASGALPLSDATFRPKNEINSLQHPYVAAPDGHIGMKAHYPKGSYTYTHKPQGGLSFYAPGPSSVDLSTAQEAVFSYSIFFEEGFEWNKGGKLPGLYGGDSDKVAISCSGGRKATDCFSVRLMWRADGAGEVYTYLPPSNIDKTFSPNDKICKMPNTECNPTYGTSISRGAFTFKSGKWNTVSQRVKLNDVGQENGEIELFFEGKSVIKVTGLVIRKSDAGKIRGIQMQTFFGGHDSSYASPRDQDVWFSDFSAGIGKSL